MSSQASVDIHVVASECRSIFATCSESPLLAQQAWFRRALAEFNLWCANLKATRSDKSSLDHRLGPRLDIREDICDLLHGLGAALVRCHESTKQEAGGIHDVPQRNPSRQHSDSSSELDKDSWDAMSYESSHVSSSADQEEGTSQFPAESILYVKTILDQLSRISLAIRKAGNRYRFERIDTELDDAAFEEFRTYLTAVILWKDPDDKNHPSSDKLQRASDYGRLSTVQKRLVECDVRRRNRMCSMTASKSEPDTAVKPHNADETEGHATTTKASNGPPTVVNTATGVDSNLDISKITGKKSRSHFTTVTRIGAAMQYPRRPKPAPEQPLQCPYCGDVVPLELPGSEHEDTWKSHVANHLSPYTCVVAECTEPYELYVSSQALLDHTIQHHSFTRWVCHYCPNGKAQDFTNMADWDSHIARKHSDLVPLNARAVLGEMSKRQMIGPLKCPLCAFATTEAATVVDDHILRHLHEFALLALPPTEESVDDRSNSSAGNPHLLPQEHPNRTDATITSEDPEVTLNMIDETIRTTWRYFTVDGVPRPPPRLGKPSFTDAAAKETWQVHSAKLIDLLKSLGFEMEHKDIQCDIQTKYDDVLHAIEGMKSTGGHADPGLGSEPSRRRMSSSRDRGKPPELEVTTAPKDDPHLLLPNHPQEEQILAQQTDQYPTDDEYYGKYTDQTLEHYPPESDYYTYGQESYIAHMGLGSTYDQFLHPTGRSADPGSYSYEGRPYEPRTSAEPGMTETPGQGFDTVVQQAQAGTYTGGTYPNYEDDGVAGPEPYGHPDASSDPIPEQGFPSAESRDGTQGGIDMSQFHVELSSKFLPGTIFKVLWSEPQGYASRNHSGTSQATERVEMTMDFYAGIRRFIVVTSDDGNSSCVPILTYERRACTKSGVNAKTHGIIHGAGHKPRSLKHEPRLGYEPVAVNLISGERLASESRVNYAKLQTVEHNVKVRIIGRVVDEHLDTVRYAVDDCWQKRAAKRYKNKH